MHNIGVMTRVITARGPTLYLSWQHPRVFFLGPRPTTKRGPSGSPWRQPKPLRQKFHKKTRAGKQLSAFLPSFFRTSRFSTLSTKYHNTIINMSYNYTCMIQVIEPKAPISMSSNLISKFIFEPPNYLIQ